MGDNSTSSGADPLAALAGGGEMGRRIRAFDWSANPLGPVEGWPQSLRSALSICLNSNFPIAIYWGADLVLLYNDEWSPIPGEKHPWALGRPAREAWPEIWHIIEPLFQKVMATGEATRSRDQLLPMHRHGFTEECYFDYTFSPIRGEGGQVEGVFNAVLETTTRVIGERRLRTLRELGAWKAGEARTAEEACRTATHTAAQNPHDLPFTLLYLLDGRGATLAGLTGLGRDTTASPAAVELDSPDAPWPFRPVAETGKPVQVDDLPARFGQLPGGAWPESSERAVVLPMARPGQTDVAGFVVAGVSPRLKLDDDYRGFLDLLAGHVAAAVASARAYEEERKRAEALAELDRAKTAFFSNVSHEFRTPLTLMLGPVEDALADTQSGLPPAQRERVEVIHRNGLRLQRLVNALLDFSRIEAGRVRATFEPTDLASYTADLASSFRSACEKAGLTLTVDCPPLGEPVFVDRQMYEKVVLNLLSNAFKFTLEGGIAVTLRRAGNSVELRVRDTGTGIPAAEMPRLFERFHRVENARGRTHEGSGIGLALVQELVKLHGGSITAESEVGNGTTFAVTFPLGADHLPRERVGTGRTTAPTAGATPFVEEALRWLPDAGGPDDPGPELPEQPNDLSDAPLRADAERSRVLVADDNADMRQYVQRLLSGAFTVEAVADGAAALDAVRRERPELVLSDVMMPRLDGFGLLRELRADPTTAGVPIILLSARAGEESRVEGVEAGADDYLVKPFSARELLARVTAQVQMARLRREAQDAVRRSEERFRLFMNHSPTTAYIKDAEGRYVFVNRTVERQFNRPLAEWVGKTDADLFPPDEARLVRRNDLSVMASGTTAEFEEASTRPDGVRHYLSFKFPLPDGGGRLLLAGMSLDITDRKRAEDERERFFAVGADLLVVAGAGGYFKRVSPACEATLGWTPAELTARPWAEFLHPDDRAATVELDGQVLQGREVLSFENRYRHKDGSYRWLNWRAKPYPAEGLIFAGASDITERKLAEQGLREGEARFRQLADAMPQIVWTAGPDGEIDYLNRRWTEYTGQPQAVGNAGWGRVLHPDDAPQANDRWAASRRGGEPFEMEVRLLDRREQAYRWHLIRTVAVKDGAGRVARWFGTATDIDGQKRAEASSRYLAEASAALAGVVDYESTLQKVVNLAVPYFADWSAVDVADGGGSLRRLAVAHQDAARVALAHELMRDYPPDPDAPTGGYAVLRTGRPELVADITDDMFVHGARDERHLGLIRSLGLRSYIGVPLVVSGTPLGVLTFATAESGRRYTEADLALATDLAHRAAVAVENTRLYQALRDADRRKDEFLATLAHELRNPLAPIRNGLQIMRLAKGGREAVETARTMMERQVGQMVHLVDDLLDLSRISRGKIELRKERVELAKVLQQAVETSRPLIDASGHDLAIDLPPQPVFVDADVTRLAQVFSNLLNNAAKYTERGGRIRLSAQHRGHEAIISVRDTGIGIPAHMLPHVFEMFTQVDRNLERSQGGLGIGLSIVKRLVEMHGGGVTARSDGPGMGSEFVVRLPVVLSVVPPQDEEGEATRPTARRRILVVDDNVDAAMSLAMMLDLMGSEARTAHDGVEALDVAAAFRPDLILLDIGMPRMNGYDTARHIREQAWGKGVVLVALTGWGQDEDRRKSKEAGFDAHMTKPIEPAALERLLASLKTDTA
ncbi:MAG: PAS domain-containing protein [Gemmataceae bacterium]|nr:PAS domain-containing protein [Gemmataceae bacterium]